MTRTKKIETVQKGPYNATVIYTTKFEFSRAHRQHCSNYYHSLRGSGSTVLTATGFINGIGLFVTSSRSPKHFAQVIISTNPIQTRNLVQMYPPIFISAGFGNSPTGQTNRRVFTIKTQSTQTGPSTWLWGCD